MTTEIEWKRRWTPDLSVSSWRPLHIDGDTFLVKSIFLQGGYEVLVTDLTSIWHEDLQEQAITARSKELNPNVEAPTRRLLEHIRSSLEDSAVNSKGCSIEFKDEEKEEEEEEGKQNMILTLNSQLAGLPFVWKFRGSPSSKEMYAEHFSIPLLVMVGELERQQSELISILKGKDREIEDYKAQGSKVTRKHLETFPFDELVFKNSMSTSKGFEGQVQQLGMSTFQQQEGQTLYKQIMTKHAWLNRVPTEGEAAETFADDVSLETGAGGATVQSWGNRLPPSLIRNSPTTSPVKSPRGGATQASGVKTTSSPESPPAKDTELLRRQALEKRLAQEEAKRAEKPKKKKKKLF